MINQPDFIILTSFRSGESIAIIVSKIEAIEEAEYDAASNVIMDSGTKYYVRESVPEITKILLARSNS